MLKLIYGLCVICIVPSISKNNLVDDLERDRAKLQEELKSLRMSSQSKSPSDSSLTDVIEAQERKIVTLKVAQKVSWLW